MADEGGDSLVGGDTEAPVPARRRRRGTLAVLIGVLAVVVLGGIWMAAAANGRNQFKAKLSERTSGPCDGDITAEDADPTFEAPTGLPDGLTGPAKAFEAYFSQERWSYRERSEDLTGDDPDDVIVYSGDGEISERLHADGFRGLIRPGQGVARFDGDRFWVPACVNGDGTVERVRFSFEEPECVETEDQGPTTRVRWTKLVDGATCETSEIWFTAATRGGKLEEWGMEIADRSRSTATAVEPHELSWPSPLWIVPTFLVGDWS